MDDLGVSARLCLDKVASATVAAWPHSELTWTQQMPSNRRLRLHYGKAKQQITALVTGDRRFIQGRAQKKWRGLTRHPYGAFEQQSQGRH